VPPFGGGGNQGRSQDLCEKIILGRSGEPYWEPLVRGKLFVEGNAQVVCRKSGSSLVGCIFRGMQRENEEVPADLRLAKSRRFALRKSSQLAGAALDHALWLLMRKRCRFGAGAPGKRKNVQVGERKRLDKCEGCCVFRVCLSGKAGDDVGADGGMRKQFADEFDAAGIVLGAIPAVHSRKDAVAAGLKGHMKMVGEPRVRGEELDEVAGNVHRLDGAKAEALDGSSLEDAAEKIIEFYPGRKVAAVSAEIDTAENNFAVALADKSPDFLKDSFGRQAAAATTYKRNNTE